MQHCTINATVSTVGYKLTNLKLIVRTMWWYHSTKTAKNLLGNPRCSYMHGASLQADSSW